MQNTTLSRSLGWFSIALGTAELFAPKQLAKFLGAEGNEGLLRLLGAREISNGLAILADEESPTWLWSRVGGDAIDLLLLVRTLMNSRKKTNAAIATASVAAVTALDVLGGIKLASRSEELALAR